MEEQKDRKTDRRTLYTKAAIKDGLLSLLEKQDYSVITITDLCREASISRGTFYIHYKNLTQVMDELFDDALGNMHSMLRQIGIETEETAGCAYPLCWFLRKNKKYQPVFFNESLYSYAVRRITGYALEPAALPSGKEKVPENLRQVFSFQISGCLYVCKQNRNVPDERWKRIQSSIDAVLKRGMNPDFSSYAAKEMEKEKNK